MKEKPVEIKSRDCWFKVVDMLHLGGIGNERTE